ncbi:unnamed protein product, partial [Mesorhabditis belari]|uniref:Uncharacterized protein n=1 Tax=Mesorhabditis belari TaxID=2138241 RepID=A0AAF3FM88_9BILA
MCLLAIGIAVYYNVLIAWASLYIFNVFKIPINDNTYVWTCATIPGTITRHVYRLIRTKNAKRSTTCRTLSKDNPASPAWSIPRRLPKNISTASSSTKAVQLRTLNPTIEMYS